MTLEARFREAMERLEPPSALGVAVSGGSDSVALLHLAAVWAALRGVRLEAATVDHGLRKGSRAEAEGVAKSAAALGLVHHILPWQDRPSGNLQASARAARHALLGRWALERSLGAVMTGHTADDQAETVLLRLLRGSGVDGLAGMAASSQLGSLRLLRPLLGLSRQELRAWLDARGIGWVDDPSNADDRFDRVRVRAVMAAMGVDAGRIVLASEHMAAAKSVLNDAAARLAEAHVQSEWATLRLDAARIHDARQETRERLWAGAVMWLTASPYRPRLRALRQFIARTEQGVTAQLAGVVALPEQGAVRLARDPAWLQRLTLDRAGAWARIRLGAPLKEGQRIAPAGPAGLAALSGWRGALPRRAALSEPVLFNDGQAVCFLHGPSRGEGIIAFEKQRPSFVESFGL